MKTFFFTLAFIFLISKISFSQTDSLHFDVNTSNISGRLKTACPDWWGHPTFFERISNPQFISTSAAGDLNPFPSNNILSWTASHGTPQLNVFGAPGWFPQNTNIASMWTERNGGAIVGEGILGNLKGMLSTTHPVETGNHYYLTFFRSFMSDPFNTTPRLDRLNIVLIKCEDADLFPGSTTNLMQPFPNGTITQQIYCETNITSTNYDMVAIDFVANNNYDLIWIYPQQVTTRGQAWINVTMPQLFSPQSLTSLVASSGGGQYLALGSNIFNSNHDWYNQSNTLLSSIPINGNTYLNYTTLNDINNPSGVMYGPIFQTPGVNQDFTYKTVIPSIITNNTCSTPVTGVIYTSPYTIYGKNSNGGLNDGSLTIDAKSTVNSTIRITAKSMKRDNLTIYVYDQLGKLLIPSLNKSVQEGSTIVDLPLPSNFKGICIVKVISKDNVNSQKILIK